MKYVISVKKFCNFVEAVGLRTNICSGFFTKPPPPPFIFWRRTNVRVYPSPLRGKNYLQVFKLKSLSSVSQVFASCPLVNKFTKLLITIINNISTIIINIISSFPISYFFINFFISLFSLSLSYIYIIPY